MYCLKAEEVDIIPFVYEVRVPRGPEGVNRAEALTSSDPCGEYPILTALKNVHHGPKAFWVDMEWTDGPFPSDKRPFSLWLGVRDLENLSILGWNTRLRHFIG